MVRSDFIHLIWVDRGWPLLEGISCLIPLAEIFESLLSAGDIVAVFLLQWTNIKEIWTLTVYHQIVYHFEITYSQFFTAYSFFVGWCLRSRHLTAPLSFCLLEKFFHEESCVLIVDLFVSCCFVVTGIKTASADILICYAESILKVNKRLWSTLTATVSPLSHL